MGGASLFAAKRFDAAARSYRGALVRDPRDAAAWFGFGSAQAARAKHRSAVAAFDRALALRPHWAEALHNRGVSLFELGEIDAALESLRDASKESQLALPAQVIATIVPGQASRDQATILTERRAYARRFLPAPRPPPLVRHGGAPRIGYLSSFFNHDNWMKPVWALVNEHDRSRFEFHFFSDASPDTEPRRNRIHPADRFHDLSGLDNDAADGVMRAQEIDVLVDLNGYSAPGRLALVAGKPAPILVAWFNMYATSGIDAYDYLIGDASVVDDDDERYYTERIVRIPGTYLTFDVTYPVPPIAPPPYARRGAMTFGCLAPLYKITDAAIRAWCRILHAVPGSTFTCRNTAFSSTRNAAWMHERFENHGIARHRIALRAPVEHLEFLRTYDDIDVALDTFPYNGGTTTMEALWQGVAVVTFRGDRWASRIGASLLGASGLRRFVARDIDEYVAIAIDLGTDRSRANDLARFREDARPLLRGSTACETRSFARAVERHYEVMIENYRS